MQMRMRVLPVIALVLSACAVGPDFARPEAPATERYTPEPLPAETAAAPVAHGAAQRLELGRDIPGEWWELFHSEARNTLIADALKNSPNIAAAEAALSRRVSTRWLPPQSARPSCNRMPRLRTRPGGTSPTSSARAGPSSPC